jgi:hypothetical protein
MQGIADRMHDNADIHHKSSAIRLSSRSLEE